MRIAYLSQSFPPMVSGAALVTARLAQGMADRGQQVLVLAASERGPAYQTNTGGLTEARLEAVPNPLRVGQRFTLAPGQAVRRTLARFQPQLVHLHDPTNLGLAGLRAARLLGSPVVLTLHQLPWFVASYLPDFPGLRRRTERLTWNYFAWWQRQCQAVVTPSETIAGLVAANTRRRPIAITNGVDLKRFNPAPAHAGEREALLARYDLPAGCPIILYVGRVDADKRVDLAVRAAAEAIRRVPAQLVVAGDGKELPAVRRLAEALGLGPAARFLGYVSARDDLPGLYRLASVFLTASEVEIQSSVVLEAAASGLPVVTVRASSMPEFVKDGRTGFLAAPGDVPALAEHLVAVLSNPDLARRLGRGALVLARHHSPQASLRRHEALYQRLLGG
jgi:glycosyltransferase involved in cell wall biosynthesis